VKSREYESKLKILRNELSQTEEELDHQHRMSKMTQDQCDTSKNKVAMNPNAIIILPSFV